MKDIPKEKLQELNEYLKAWEEAMKDIYTDKASMRKFLEYRRKKFFDTE